MGKRYLHSIVTPNTDLVASADITPFDLPVNPLSLLLLHLQITNVAPAAIGTYSAIDDVITQITNINVKHKGENIISGSLRDLMVLNAVAFHLFPGATRMINTDNVIRDFVFPLCLGRRAYDPMSCFPATTRGNLRYEMTAGADGAAYDDINFSLEAVELIEATPTEYVKYITNARTSVIGQFDASLPIGNPILGILGFDTDINTGTTTHAPSWGTVKLLKDNVEQYYPLSDVETLCAMLAMQLRSLRELDRGHVHQINDGAALSDSDDAEALASHGTNGYFYLDFDPLRDGQYELETAGAADLKIRGVGEAASAIRWLPVERVSIR